MLLPTVKFSDAQIYHDDALILRDVNLELFPKELVFLVGKTGAGKSSLLKTLYAQLPLQKGIGKVLGYDLTNLTEKMIPEFRRQLGIIFQDFHLLNDRSVYDNLSWVLKATGWNEKKNIDLRIREVLNLVGLEKKAKDMPYKISGGEQQRLVIARSILNHPKLILADEPTGNLDPETSDEIMNLLLGMQVQTQATILIATHDYRIIEQHPATLLKVESETLQSTNIFQF